MSKSNFTATLLKKVGMKFGAKNSNNFYVKIFFPIIFNFVM